MKPDIPPPLFAPQPAALAAGVTVRDPLDVARAALLGPAALDDDRVAAVLGDVMGHAVDYADIYFQLTREESWALEDGIVKDGAHSIEQGVGVRALAGEKTGFAYSDEVMLPALLEAAHAARAISRSGAGGSVQAWHATGGRGLYSAVDPVETMADGDKVRLLEQIDREARSLDSRITQVMASLSASHDIVLVMASDGTLAGDVRPLVRLNVSVIIEQDGRREQGYAGGGGRFAYTEFLASERWRALVKEAVRTAQVNLEAVPAPAGTMTVVLGAGWPGVLLHEAVLNVDDEGTPTQCTTLIEDGILHGYLQDKLNARLMGVQPTGNGRRESFAALTLPRMTNTYMLPGQHAPEEIIASVDKGLYCRNFGGGQVDITSGKFVFSASEAYLIENGRITRPVKGATLIGNGPDVMTRVSMIGNDLKLDDGVGTCGKEGQEVPVGVGQPTLRVDALTVGGTG